MNLLGFEDLNKGRHSDNPDGLVLLENEEILVLGYEVVSLGSGGSGQQLIIVWVTGNGGRIADFEPLRAGQEAKDVLDFATGEAFELTLEQWYRF